MVRWCLINFNCHFFYYHCHLLSQWVLFALFFKNVLRRYEVLECPSEQFVKGFHSVNSLFVPKKTIVELYNEKTVIAIKKDIEQENINPKVCNVRKKVSENNIEEKLNQILNERLINNHMI